MTTPRRSGSTDPRAVRVRDAVKTAAFTLTTQQPVAEISVADILRTAGVSRQAFYEHFRDRDAAILAAIAADLATALHPEGDVNQSLPDILRRLTVHTGSHRQIYLHMRGSPIFDAAVDSWRQLLMPTCRDLAAHAITARGEVLDDADLQTLAAFVLGGLLENIRRWLRSETPLPPADQSDLMWRHITRLLGS